MKRTLFLCLVFLSSHLTAAHTPVNKVDAGIYAAFLAGFIGRTIAMSQKRALARQGNQNTFHMKMLDRIQKISTGAALLSAGALVSRYAYNNAPNISPFWPQNEQEASVIGEAVPEVDTKRVEPNYDHRTIIKNYDLLIPRYGQDVVTTCVPKTYKSQAHVPAYCEQDFPEVPTGSLISLTTD